MNISTRESNEIETNRIYFIYMLLICYKLVVELFLFESILLFPIVDYYLR